MPVKAYASHLLKDINTCLIWGLICVKFHRHSVQAQLATMQAQSAKMRNNIRAQHKGTTCMHNMHAQHEDTT